MTSRVLLECAGNGRARLEPRPVSQPWLLEAVGTAEWTGTPLAPLLEEAGLSPDAVDVAFTGADHGVERGVEQDYARGLPLAEALRPETLLVWAMNGAPLPPQHGAPLRLLVPGWYGMAQVKWLTRIDVLTEPFTGFQNATAYRLKVDAHEDGEPVTRIRPRALLAPPGWPDFMTRERFVHAGPVPLSGPRVVRPGTGHPRRGQHRRRADLGRRAARRRRTPPIRSPGGRGPTTGRRARAGSSCSRGPPTRRRSQPVEAEWNRQGLANNLVAARAGQRARLTSRSPTDPCVVAQARRRAPAEGTVTNVRGAGCPSRANRSRDRRGHGVDRGPASTRAIGAAPEAASDHAGAVRARPEGRLDAGVQQRDRDLEVVPQRLVARGEHRPDRPGVGVPTQRGDHLQHPGVLGDDVPRPAQQQLPRRGAVGEGSEAGDVVHLAQQGDAEARGRLLALPPAVAVAALGVVVRDVPSRRRAARVRPPRGPAAPAR